MPAPVPPYLLPPEQRFAYIMAALARAMAEQANANRFAGPLVVLIWTRLNRLAARFSAILLRHHRAPAPARPRAPRATTTRTIPPDQRRKTLPRGFAWLRRLLPVTAGYASQLDHLLADPEMAAIIAATPATGRALRPLCHLLGIRPPPSLRLPPRQPQADPDTPHPDAPPAGSASATHHHPQAIPPQDPPAAPPTAPRRDPPLHPRFIPPRRKFRFCS